MPNLALIISLLTQLAFVGASWAQSTKPDQVKQAFPEPIKPSDASKSDAAKLAPPSKKADLYIFLTAMQGGDGKGQGTAAPINTIKVGEFASMPLCRAAMESVESKALALNNYEYLVQTFTCILNGK